MNQFGCVEAAVSESSRCVSPEVHLGFLRLQCLSAQSAVCVGPEVNLGVIRRQCLKPQSVVLNPVPQTAVCESSSSKVFGCSKRAELGSLQAAL